MANRVTVAEVKQIIDIDSAIVDANITIFINAANIFTNLVNTTGGMTSTTQLKEIERWLSAHLVAIRDMRVASEKAGPASQTFQYKVDLNFNVTVYGQQALLLDTTGTLASLQKQAKGDGGGVASFTAFGPVSDQEVTDSA